VAYLIQGFAVVHGVAHERKWPAGAMAAVYVVFFIGLGFMAPAMTMVGLTDTWADFRGRARGAA
jgi:hydrogenase/urease accessory protein HupE